MSRGSCLITLSVVVASAALVVLEPPHQHDEVDRYGQQADFQHVHFGSFPVASVVVGGATEGFGLRLRVVAHGAGRPVARMGRVLRARRSRWVNRSGTNWLMANSTGWPCPSKYSRSMCSSGPPAVQSSTAASSSVAVTAVAVCSASAMVTPCDSMSPM